MKQKSGNKYAICLNIIGLYFGLTILYLEKAVYLCSPEILHSSNKSYNTNFLNSSKVTKAEVITEIAEKTGIDKADVQHTIEAFFNVVKSSMAKGENIYVRGFGSFVNKKRAKKIARNISKNTAMVIEEHYVPSFKPAKVFVEKIKSSDKIKVAS